MSKNKLPRGFRITGDIHSIHPYDIGDWLFSLQVWETRTLGMWLWKHDVTQWWTVAKDSNKESLVQTAWLMHEDKKK